MEGQKHTTGSEAKAQRAKTKAGRTGYGSYDGSETSGAEACEHDPQYRVGGNEKYLCRIGAG